VSTIDLIGSNRSAAEMAQIPIEIDTAATKFSQAMA
jgi:hypothetical protein